MARRIEIEIVGSTKDLEAALGRAGKETSSFQEKLGKATKVASVGLAALAGGGYKAYQAASNLNEASNATGLIFKSSRGEIDQFVKSASKIGQSERAAREATTTFGGLLQNLKFSRQESIGWSKDLTVLASDLGSAFNADPAEAVEAIGSALRGETEPIRRFNVMLDDATVRQKAVAMGLANSTAEVTKNGKAQAALALIMEQTKAVHGDFANTAHEGANAQRVAAAEAENAAAQFGKSLMPAMKAVIGVGRDLLAWTVDHQRETKVLVAVVAGLGGAVLAVTAAIKVYVAGQAVVRAATVAWTAAQWLLNAALTANPIALVVLALIALGAGLVLAWKRSETFREIVTGAWERLKDIAEWISVWAPKIGGWLVDAFRVTPLGILVGRLDDAWRLLKRLAEWIQNHVGALAENLAKPFRQMWFYVKKIIDGIKWLIDKIPDIPGPSGFDLIAGGGGRPPGGVAPPGPTGPIGTGDSRFTPKIWDEMAIGRGMGLNLGANSSGRNYGDHGRRPSHAIDMYGTRAEMSAFANAMYGRAGSKDVFYGYHSRWQDNGRMISGWGGNEDIRDTHYSHVHYSVFDRGGVLKPGLSLVANLTGKPEPLVPAMPGRHGGEVHYHAHVDVHGLVGHTKEEIGRHVVAALKAASRDGATVQNWSPGFS